MDKNTFVNRYMEKIILLLGIRPSIAADMAEAAFADWDDVEAPEKCAENESEYWRNG
ncbi:MAG: hypothetical protein ABIL58_23540 [Pseudomonadota bacterium]